VRAIVVGGSLGGLTCALRLARAGIEVTVVERDPAPGKGAAGLGVDRRALSAIVGEDAFRDGISPALPVIRTNRDSTAWSLLHRWLRDACAARSNIALEWNGCASAVLDDGRTVALVDGRTIEADVVIGADGYRSLVRTVVAPDRPIATYAGYLLWRGLCEESDIPEDRRMRGIESSVSVARAGPYRLVAYHVPGANGGTGDGQRRISWAWYDADRNPLLQQTGSVVGTEVCGTLPGHLVPPEVVDELCDLAPRLWAGTWAAAILACLRERRFIATPIAEYLPVRLAKGSVAIMGDAAHVASPMTGSGFEFAMHDADALGRALASANGGGVAAALSAYEADRLAADQALAQYGMRWGQHYLAEVRR
jgi:2-polyprenyl-6-methoxyphenol hydroxylase-like FAD-dependent oxidoreductase